MNIDDFEPELQRILNMTEAELRAECEAAGRNWDEEVAEARSCFELALADVTERALYAGTKPPDQGTLTLDTLMTAAKLVWPPKSKPSCGCHIIHTCGFVTT